MTVAVPSGVRVLAVALGLAALASVVMVAVTVWNGPAQDVPRGEGPALSAAAFAAWAAVAILAGTAAVFLWSLAPEGSWDDEDLDEAWTD